MAGGRGGDRSTLAQVAGSAAIGRPPRFLFVLVQVDVNFEPKDLFEEVTSARFLQAPLAPLSAVLVFVVPHVDGLVANTDEKMTARRRRRHVEALGLGRARRRRPCWLGWQNCAGRTKEGHDLIRAAWNSWAPARAGCEGGPGPHASGLELLSP